MLSAPLADGCHVCPPSSERMMPRPLCPPPRCWIQSPLKATPSAGKAGETASAMDRPPRGPLLCQAPGSAGPPWATSLRHRVPERSEGDRPPVPPAYKARVTPGAEARAGTLVAPRSVPTAVQVSPPSVER